jgi:hypothetical protein
MAPPYPSSQCRLGHVRSAAVLLMATVGCTGMWRAGMQAEAWVAHLREEVAAAQATATQLTDALTHDSSGGGGGGRRAADGGRHSPTCAVPGSPERKGRWAAVPFALDRSVDACACGLGFSPICGAWSGHEK